MSVSLTCTSEYHKHIWYPQRPEEGIRSPMKLGVPCGHREPNLGPPEEQSVLPTPETSFHPSNYQIKANLYQQINTLSVIIFGFAEDSWIIAYVLQIIRIQCRHHMVRTGCHKNTLIGPASRNLKNKQKQTK